MRGLGSAWRSSSAGSPTDPRALLPTLVAAVGITGSFFLFAAIGVVAFLFVHPGARNRGRSLEALEEECVRQIYVGMR